MPDFLWENPVKIWKSRDVIITKNISNLEMLLMIIDKTSGAVYNPNIREGIACNGN